MLKVYLRAPETDTRVWLAFPVKYQTVNNLYSILGKGPFEIVEAETSLETLSICLKGKYFEVEKTRYELDFLNRRIESLTDMEKDVFTAALNIEAPFSIEEIVNLSCNLDKFQIWKGIQEIKQLGEALIRREHGLSKTMTLLLDEEQIGKAYSDTRAGWFSKSGYVMRTGEPFQIIYEGKKLPDPAYDRRGIFQLLLMTDAYADTHPNAYSLFLPASEEKMERARENLKVDKLNEAKLLGLYSPGTSLEDVLPVDYQIEELNAFSFQLRELRRTESKTVLEKLKAVLCAEMPATMQTVMEINENLDRYEILPEDIQTARAYAEHLIEKEMIQIDPQLKDYMDLDRLGMDRMKRDGVTQTKYGFVLRKDRPISPLPESIERIRLFSPLTADMYIKDEWGELSSVSEEVTSFELCDYETQILELIQREHLDHEGQRGLALYLDNQLLARKICSMHPTVEVWHGELWGVLEIKSRGTLSEKELEAVKEYWQGQESDGWGEGFEQREIQTLEGELYVSFWNSGDDFFIKTEEELKESKQGSVMRMGGM